MAEPKEGYNSGFTRIVGGAIDSSGDFTQNDDGIATVEQGVIAGERNPDSADGYLAAVDECSYTAVGVDTDVSTSGPGLVFGVLVTVAFSGTTMALRDANSAGAGTVVLTIPDGAAIGTFWDLKGAKFNTGIYADFTGTTGDAVILWRGQ